MMKTSELELIMAYHDGELSPEERAEVEGWFDTRPEPRVYLDELEAADQHYREGFAALLEQTTTAPLAEKLAAASSTPRAEGITGKMIRFPFSALSRQNWALAASLALMLALGGGWWMQFQSGSGQPAFAQALDRALETTPSGEVYQGTEAGVKIMPLASYRTDRQGLCREYTGRSQSQQVFGLACRRGRAQWAPVVEEGHELNSASEADIYLPASGRKDTLTEQLDDLGANQVLTTEQETRLIANQWR